MIRLQAAGCKLQASSFRQKAIFSILYSLFSVFLPLTSDLRPLTSDSRLQTNNQLDRHNILLLNFEYLINFDDEFVGQFLDQCFQLFRFIFRDAILFKFL